MKILFYLSSLLFSCNVSALSDCAGKTPDELIEQAVTIFAGTLIKEELKETDKVESTFKVRRVFKGNPSELETIISPITSDACEVSYGHESVDVVMVDENNHLSSCCSYDVYYPIERSNRADITYRGISKALRKKTKCEGQIFLYVNNFDSEHSLLREIYKIRYELESSGVGVSYLRNQSNNATCFNESLDVEKEKLAGEFGLLFFRAKNENMRVVQPLSRDVVLHQIMNFYGITANIKVK